MKALLLTTLVMIFGSQASFAHDCADTQPTTGTPTQIIREVR